MLSARKSPVVNIPRNLTRLIVGALILTAPTKTVHQGTSQFSFRLYPSCSFECLSKMKAPATARLCPIPEVLPLRTRYREEMNCQIVHDSIHQRPGWMLCYALQAGDAVAGFGSIAIAGPWKDKPTVSEFYLLPEYRAR